MQAHADARVHAIASFMTAVLPWEPAKDDPDVTCFDPSKPRLRFVEGCISEKSVTFLGKVMAYICTVIRKRSECIMQLNAFCGYVLKFLNENMIDVNSDGDADDLSFDRVLDDITRTASATCLLISMSTSDVDVRMLWYADSLNMILDARVKLRREPKSAHLYSLSADLGSDESGFAAKIDESGRNTGFPSCGISRC